MSLWLLRLVEGLSGVYCMSVHKYKIPFFTSKNEIRLFSKSKGNLVRLSFDKFRLPLSPKGEVG